MESLTISQPDSIMHSTSHDTACREWGKIKEEEEGKKESKADVMKRKQEGKMLRVKERRCGSD